MSNDDTTDPRVKGTPVSDGTASAVDAADQMANLAAATSTIPVYKALRAMRGRGVNTMPLNLSVGQVVRVDGMKYRVMETPKVVETGSVAVESYSEDNQFETLFLSTRRPVRVIGDLP